jgi:hypothetical protein
VGVALDIEGESDEDVAADGCDDADQTRPILEVLTRTAAIAVTVGEG